MITTNERWVITYNGEIYNFKEIRKELEAEGFFFKSQTDSEVVLYSLAHWGKDALLKFNGMYALALCRKLLLARDLWHQTTIL